MSSRKSSRTNWANVRRRSLRWIYWRDFFMINNNSLRSFSATDTSTFQYEFATARTTRKVDCSLLPSTWRSSSEVPMVQRWSKSILFFILRQVDRHRWSQRGNDYSSYFRLLDHGAKLQIDSARVSDAGFYTCVLSNSVGESNFTYQLDVLSEMDRSILQSSSFQWSFFSSSKDGSIKSSRKISSENQSNCLFGMPAICNTETHSAMAHQ
jgi:hypothetical protein